MTSVPKFAVTISGLHHAYAEKVALADFNLNVEPGQIVAVLGRNGSGKTTLFRLLSTLLPIRKGEVTMDGVDVARDARTARSRLGIIFQSPSLDVQLSVRENMVCQGALYGLRGVELSKRIEMLLDQFSLTDRRDERCQTLSGGLKRRVELAKGLLHQPRVMLLDEPSTGLDPAARLSLWESLTRLAQDGVAVLLTTHLMDEAEKAARVVLMDAGKKVADDSPTRLRESVGGGMLTILADDIDAAQRTLKSMLGLDTTVVAQSLRAACESPAIVPLVAEVLGHQLQSISLGRPSLEDVFVAKTGSYLR